MKFAVRGEGAEGSATSCKYVLIAKPDFASQSPIWISFDVLPRLREHRTEITGLKVIECHLVRLAGGGLGLRY